MEKTIIKPNKVSVKTRRNLFITLTAGVLIFFILFLSVWNYILGQEKDVFRYQSDIIQERLIGNITTGETVANSIIALYHSSEYVSRTEFTVFMNEIFRRYGFINSVYYYKKMKDSHDFQIVYTMINNATGMHSFPEIITTSSFDNSIHSAINSGFPVIVPVNKDSSLREQIYIIISGYRSKAIPENESEREFDSNGIIIIKINLKAMMLSQKIPEECSYILEIKDKDTPDDNIILLENDAKKFSSGFSSAFSLADLKYSYSTSIAGQTFILTISRIADFSMMHFLSFAFAFIIGVLLTSGINTITKKSIRINEQNDDLIEIGNFLTGIINSMRSMLISVTTDFRITHWNSAAEKFTGIPVFDAMNKNILDIIPFLKIYEQDILTCMNLNSSHSFNFDDVYKGKRRFFNISVFPMTFHKAPGVIIMIDDISELKTIDNELKQIQKMETIGNLAGGLAHDLNNILGGIYGVTDVLKFKYSNNIKVENSDISKFLEIIENQSKRAADITDHLLSIARKSELNLVKINLTQTILDILNLCRSSFDKQIEIIFNHDNVPCYALADVTQISQVLLNIFINASHAMTTMKLDDEKYGGQLIVSIELFNADKHFITLHPADSYSSYYWIISVTDTGIGMDSQTMEKIFDPFYTTKENKGGSGLGLSMVYNIIRQHNGFIDVYSEKGIGSKFNIYIPSVQTDIADTADTDITAPVIQPSVPGGLILIIDDEEIMRNIAAVNLREYGFSVLLAKDGEEGLKLFSEQHEKISAVLLDMIMPKLSGIEVYHEMHKIDNDVRILITSGFRPDDLIQKYKVESNCGFIQKPYPIQKLITEISKIIK